MRAQPSICRYSVRVNMLNAICGRPVQSCLTHPQPSGAGAAYVGLGVLGMVASALGRRDMLR